MLSRRQIVATYDRTALRYGETFSHELDRKPFDRTQLDAFAAAATVGGGPVCDVGCGPGHVSRYLGARGVRSFGLDLSRAMIAEARRATPTLAGVVGDLSALPLADASLAGLVAFYSIIHLARPEAGPALAGMRGALRPGAPLLVAFHGGTGEITHDEFLGEQTPIAATLFEQAEMQSLMTGAGLTAVRVLVRAPYDFEYQTPRLYAWARRPRV